MSRAEDEDKGIREMGDERKRAEMRFVPLKIHHDFERMRLRGLSAARDETGCHHLSERRCSPQLRDQPTSTARGNRSGYSGNCGHPDYRVAPPSPTSTNGAQNAGCTS